MAGPLIRAQDGKPVRKGAIIEFERPSGMLQTDRVWRTFRGRLYRFVDAGAWTVNESQIVRVLKEA